MTTNTEIMNLFDEVWEKAKAAGDFDAMEKLLDIMEDHLASRKKSPTAVSTISDHTEQDKMSIYEYDGYTGQYDRDTGCWCVDYRK